MATTTEPPGEPMKERLEALVRIEDKVEQAAEAAADAAAHAVEATKAAEAASVARVAAKKATTAPTAKAARAAKTAKSKAGKATKAAAAARLATETDALLEPTGPLQNPSHVVDVRLTDDELDQIERLAAKQELPVPDLARSLLVRALNRSREA